MGHPRLARTYVMSSSSLENGQLVGIGGPEDGVEWVTSPAAPGARQPTVVNTKVVVEGVLGAVDVVADGADVSPALRVFVLNMASEAGPPAEALVTQGAPLLAGSDGGPGGVATCNTTSINISTAPEPPPPSPPPPLGSTATVLLQARGAPRGGGHPSPTHSGMCVV